MRGAYAALLAIEPHFQSYLVNPAFLQHASMIFGFGTDLVKVSRIASTLNRFGSQFVNRILSPREREEFDTYTRDKSQFLASR